MVEQVDSFLETVYRYDLQESFSILDDILGAGKIQSFGKRLQELTENKTSLLPYQLHIRDHIYEYLDCHPLYFSLYLPSYALLNKIAGITDPNHARAHVGDLVRNMMESEDPTLDMSFVEIDQLMNSRYIVILPSVLEIRNDEIDRCKIQYSSVVISQNIRYCISELLQTYFGRKMAAALNFDIRNPIIGSKDFNRLEKTLKTLNHDVEAMLVRIPDEEWPQFADERTRAMTKRYGDSNELMLLYETSIARIEMGTDTWEAKWSALETISESMTKFCNDVVGLAAHSDDVMIQIPSIQLLERTRDVSQIPLLSDVLNKAMSEPNVPGGVKAAVSKAISVLSSTQFSSSIMKDQTTPTASDPEMFKYVRNHMVPRMAEMLELASRSPEFSVEKEEFVTGLLLEGMGPYFEKMMNDPDTTFRLKLLEIAAFLPKDDARGIVARGLQDKDPTIATRATEILETRWADEFW